MLRLKTKRVKLASKTEQMASDLMPSHPIPLFLPRYSSPSQMRGAGESPFSLCSKLLESGELPG